ncbi:MAG: hypothetical protein HYY44_09825 [Deltaproteobacteria bacterium]|nr:hypothetical protein [Deltaproteobacteria bacterium]
MNGGIGNGIEDAYFCSGKDELAAWRRRSSQFINTFSANDPIPANQGTYQCMMIKNRCRTEGGCGDVPPDGKCMVVCSPHYATNCYPLGKRRAWDDSLYATASLSGNPQGGNPAFPSTIDHTGWADRNYRDDLSYGRYLIDQIDCPASNPTGTSIASAMEVQIPNQNVDYELGNPGNKYVDLPYTGMQLRWFACNQIARQGGYKTHLEFRDPPPAQSGGTMLDQERIDHYKTLFTLARNQWGKQIASGELGQVYRTTNPQQKEMRKIASQIWKVLNEMVNLLPGSCGDQGCPSPRRPPTPINLRCGTTAYGTTWEYNPAANRLTLNSGICTDVQGKRTTYSHSHHNLSGATAVAHGEASYGEWRGSEGIDSPDAGLFEPLFGTVRGVNLFVRRNAAGEESLSSVYAGYVSAEGYSPLVIAKLAHEAVHVISQRRLGRTQLAGWPNSPESIYQEELALMTEAVTYSILCQNGFCPRNYDMEKNDFLITVANISDRGVRFDYPHECRGRGGVFLGPLCTNLLNIARHLKDGRVEIAKLMSLWHTSAPLLKPPAQMTRNGEYCAYTNNPTGCPPLPGSQPNPSPGPGGGGDIVVGPGGDKDDKNEGEDKISGPEPKEGEVK